MNNSFDASLIYNFLHVSIPPVIKKNHLSEARRRRWVELNLILTELAAKNKKLKDSAAYSSLTWNLVSPVYSPIIHLYSQPIRKVPEEKIKQLHNYLVSVTRRLGYVTSGKESQRLHFIAPILIYVSELFGPEDPIQIGIEENLNGVNVKANGHFEFMLKRKNKIICIIEAKNDAMEQGMAQNLVGLEVASEKDGLDIVYGIVTNYIE